MSLLEQARSTIQLKANSVQYELKRKLLVAHRRSYSNHEIGVSKVSSIEQEER